MRGLHVVGGVAPSWPAAVPAARRETARQTGNRALALARWSREPRLFVCRVCGACAVTSHGQLPIGWPEAGRCGFCGEAA